MANLLGRFFAPPAEAPPIAAAPHEIRRIYRYWRRRQLYTTFVGYAVFYFVRKNIPVALPLIESELGFSKTQLGGFLTAHDLLYGVSKFGNGILGDRSNPRTFMALGLLLSAGVNLAFGLSSGLYTLGLLWMLNGWFQGMGFPPCARVLSHWFGTAERGTTWGLWNTSHQVGAAVIFVLAGAIAPRFGWRSCFLFPALIAIGVSLFLLNRLRDTPGSLGLPPVETYTGEEPNAAMGPEPTPEGFRRTLRTRVFGNRFVWFLCVANFFVYIVRYAFVNWAPAYLHERRGVPLDHAGWMVAGFEVAGLAGSLAAGWMSDKLFGSRRGPVCVGYMSALALLVAAFWRAPAGHIVLDAALLLSIGFFVYGPQFLVGVMTADLVGKHSAATAIGLTGLFGYASGIVSGVGLGWIVDRHGWDGCFVVLIGCAITGVGLFALTWSAVPERSGAAALGT